MKINRFKITSYKGLENINIELNSNFNLLYGKNSIGKTRIIFFICDYIYKGLTLGLVKDNDEHTEFSGEMEFTLNDRTFKTSVVTKKEYFELFTSNNKEGNYKYTKYVTISEGRKRFSYNYSFGEADIFKNLMINFQEKFDISFKDFVETIIGSINPLFTDKAHYSLEDYELSASKEDINSRKDISLITSKIICRIDNTVESYVEDYEIIEENNETNINKYMIRKYIILKNGLKISLNSSNISSGIKRISLLGSVLVSLSKSENNIYLLDEIDPFIHDFLFSSIAKYMKRQSMFNQILLVSHNSSVINVFSRKEVLYAYEDSDKNIVVKNVKSNNTNSLTNYEKMYRDKKIFDIDFNSFDLEDILDNE